MTTNSPEETLHPAFPPSPHPLISYGLPFPSACLKHITSTFNASRVYVLSSGSLARNTSALRDLQSALGDKVVGTRIGMKPHTLWSEILEIVHEARESQADILVTLGAGSLTDGAKIVALVRCVLVHSFTLPILVRLRYSSLDETRARYTSQHHSSCKPDTTLKETALNKSSAYTS